MLLVFVQLHRSVFASVMSNNTFFCVNYFEFATVDLSFVCYRTDL